MDFIPQKLFTGLEPKNNPILELKNISKSFGEVSVLQSIQLKAYAGEIIALVGENGAGKSTLMKILSGVWSKNNFSGSFFVQGEETFFYSTKDAQKKGIAIIHQELQLIPELSISENIFLGREPHTLGFIHRDPLYQKTQKLLDELNISLDPSQKVKTLSLGEKQLVEIAKSLRENIRILILDEPTSALTEKEIYKLFSILKKLKHKGVLCIYISHKLEEILEISDRIFVLRDGSLISERKTKDASTDVIIQDMVGRKLSQIYPKRSYVPKEIVLEVSNLSCKKKSKSVLQNISFSIRKGEILGVSGLMGSGRSELIHTIFGSTSFHVEGALYLENKKVQFSSPREALSNGLSLLTEDRKWSGIIPLQSIQTNMTLSALKQYSYRRMINDPKEKNIVLEFIEQFKIKTPSTINRCDAKIIQLSGGNQQKVLLARCLLTKPKVLFLDEPTRGVDVGSKADIYRLIHELAQSGVAIILVSSDLPEVLNMSDRVAVLNQGHLMGILSKEEATPEKVMFLATAPILRGKDT